MIFVAFALFLNTLRTAAVAQWARAFASQAEGWVFESQPRQTVVKKGSDSSTAKRSAKGVCVTGNYS